jgi:hypothetical protein
LIPSEDGRESYDHSEALPEAKGSHPSDHDLAAVHAPNHHRASVDDSLNKDTVPRDTGENS